MNPYFAAKQGHIDEIIMPEDTRQKLTAAFGGLKGKKQTIAYQKKHGNISL